MSTQQTPFIQWELNEDGTRKVTQRLNEDIKITSGQCILTYKPSRYWRVIMADETVGATTTVFTEIEMTDAIDSIEKFKVNYETGNIYFHTDWEGYTLTVSQYYSEGVILYWAGRIYYYDALDQIHTLEDAISTGNIILSDFVEAATYTAILNTDTVSEAFGKTQKFMTDIGNTVQDTILSDYVVASTASDIDNTDTAVEAFGKVQKQIDVADANIATNVTAIEKELKNVATLDTPSTDYLAHLYTVTGYLQSQTMPNNANGKVLWNLRGLTATNLVNGESVANGASVSFASVSENKYYDTLNNVVLTGTGSEITVTNNSGSAASMMVIDLTNCGLQSKTVAELAQIFQFYFSGTKSTLSQNRIRSIGKNIVDYDTVFLGYHINASTGAVSQLSIRFLTDYIRVLPNTTYTRSLEDSHRQTAFFDRNKNYISGSVINTFTTPANAAYLRASSNMDNLYTFQIEQGSSATPYERGTLSSIYTPPGVLRSAPNWTYDEIFCNGNGNFKSKRISDTINISGTMYESLDTTTYTNVDIVKTTSLVYSRIGTANKDGITNIYNSGGSVINEVAYADIDFASSVGKYYYHTDKKVWLIVAKGTYPDIASARTGLGTCTANYVLNTWEIAELETIGELKTYPNTKIITEPCYSGYATGASTVIGTPEVPIKAIRKVESISLDASGNVVRTNVKASCSVDATTLTIADYDATKVYFYDLDIDAKYTTNSLKTLQAECPTAVATHNFAAGSTAWTLTENENKATYFTMTNAGGAANCIAEAKTGKITAWKNASGQTLTVKTASSTGVTIANAKTATLMYTGTDFIKLSEV